ncbi:hypothetical protein CGRA01v4_04869 [Colletotrichum graminicola]|nr:hypothetical protein CGRA01v4_04869 [Colletotrichum graminicola]
MNSHAASPASIFPSSFPAPITLPCLSSLYPAAALAIHGITRLYMYMHTRLLWVHYLSWDRCRHPSIRPTIQTPFITPHPTIYSFIHSPIDPTIWAIHTHTHLHYTREQLHHASRSPLYRLPTHTSLPSLPPPFPLPLLVLSHPSSSTEYRPHLPSLGYCTLAACPSAPSPPIGLVPPRPSLRLLLCPPSSYPNIIAATLLLPAFPSPCSTLSCPCFLLTNTLSKYWLPKLGD